MKALITFAVDVKLVLQIFDNYFNKDKDYNCWMSMHSY